MSWREDIYRFQPGCGQRNIPTNIGDLISDDRMLTELLTQIYGHQEEEVNYRLPSNVRPARYQVDTEAGM